MTDREAIKMLQGCACTPVMRRAINKGIKALQEREKRSKGCEVCDPNPKAVWYRFKDKNVLCSFCPVCGKPLKG